MMRGVVLLALLLVSLGQTQPAAAQTREVTSQPLVAPAEPVAPKDPAAPTKPAEPVAAGAAADAPAAQPAADPSLPQVFYGEEGLPEKVRDMRRRIIAATKTGELESLRPVIDSNEVPPSFSGGDSGDAIGTLKLLSGDDKGREILAILLEVLEAGYVHVDAGTPQEMYIWPYFTRIPLAKLTGPQLVELFRLIGAGDLVDMQDKGVYSFYRVGIGPDGVWHYFEDGD